MRLGSFVLRAQGESRAMHSRGVDFVQRGDVLSRYVMEATASRSLKVLDCNP